jgi:hypothetical protein
MSVKPKKNMEKMMFAQRFALYGNVRDRTAIIIGIAINIALSNNPF